MPLTVLLSLVAHAQELPREVPTCEPGELTCTEGGCLEDPLWGFADLHTHPAAHLAFGNERLVEGLPGMGWDPMSSTIDTDLVACDGDKHNDAHGDPLLDTGRTMVFTALEGSGHDNHLPSGFPTFETWPSATSPTHQQMHIDWVRRAYDGGLRLLVASVTDNQLLETLWTRKTSLSLEYDLCEDAEGNCDIPSRDLDSAKTQLAFIHDWVDANAEWMAIVTSASEAECVIRQGRLAVVLGLEMDSLTPAQILELQETHHVSLVTPIHLANHPQFGGTAAYSDIFNVLNRALRGKHIQTREDPALRWRFAAPQMVNDWTVPVAPLLVPWMPFATQTSVGTGSESQCNQSYEACGFRTVVATTGHANVDGLASDGPAAIEDLLEANLIVDLAHMSDLSQDEVLTIATELEVPVVNSHTGLRPTAPAEAELGMRQVSERDLKESHLARIGATGGTIGLGTEGDLQLARVGRVDGSPLVTLNPDGVSSFSWEPRAPRLRLMIETGDDDLCSASTVEFAVQAAGATPTGTLQQTRDGSLRDLDTLGAHELDWIDIPLPLGTQPEDLDRLDLSMFDGSGDGCDGDDWTIDTLEVYFLGPDQAVRLFSDHDEPLLEFRGDGEPIEVPLDRDGREVLEVELWTGGDDLRCGAWAELSLAMSDGTLWTDDTAQQLTPDDSLPIGSYHSRPLALPELYSPEDVAQLGIRRHNGTCVGEASPDNWNLEAIRVSRPGSGSDEVLLHRSGWPTFRFSGSHSEVSLPLDHAVEPRRATAQHLLLTVRTANDDLQADRTALASVFVAGRTSPVVVDLNQGTLWRDGSTHDRWVDLGSGTTLTDVERVTIDVSGGGDDWKVAGLELRSPGTPIERWWQAYERALATLGRAPAFGTDFNGLQIQLDFAEVSPSYPLVPWGGPDVMLPAQVIGSRTVDFQSEGLSNIGQLPDFIGALEQVTPDPSDAAPLYSSAQAFVEMWVKLEQR